MSTKTSTRQNRPQKHKNKTAWKPDQFKTDPKTKLVQSIRVDDCCERCTGIIQWKIDYGKYKPLSAPSKCIKCEEKRVRFAYRTICSKCCSQAEVCAKCGEKRKQAVESENVDELKLELDRGVKLLSERRRRTFLRYLAKEEEAVDKPTEDDSKPKSLTQVRREARDKLNKLIEEAKDDLDDDFEDDFDDLEI